MWFFNSGPVVPVLRLSGAIGMVTPFRPGLSIASLAGPIEKAFHMSKLPAVAVVVNSPGGSPVQSNLILRRLRQLGQETKKKVYVFCEDVAASGGYYVALAGDQIYADASSIVGSIGVISASFGLDKAIGKLGIDRRVYTSGEHKGTLDISSPKSPMTSPASRKSSAPCMTYSSASSRSGAPGSSRARTASCSPAPSGRPPRPSNTA